MATPKPQQQISPFSKESQPPSAISAAEEIIKKYGYQGYNTAFNENDIVAKDSIFEKDVVFKVRIESQNSKKKVDINLVFDLQSIIGKDYLLSDTGLSSKTFEILKTEKLPKFERRVYYTFDKNTPSDVFLNFVKEFVFNYNTNNQVKIFTEFEDERFSFGGIPEKDINKFLKLFIEEILNTSQPYKFLNLELFAEFSNASKKLTIKNKLIN